MMSKNGKTVKFLANLALVMSGAIWGFGTVVMKNLLDVLPVNWVMAMRFTVGALCLSVFLFRNRDKIDKGLIWRGLLLGFAQYLTFSLGTYGLAYTTAGKNSMLMGTYVILVPFFVWAARKVKPKLRILAAAVICIAGVMLLCLNGNENSGFNKGDLISIGCSVACALLITLSNLFFGNYDVMHLTCLQFSTTALISWCAALLFEPAPAGLITAPVIAPLAYICLASTVVAMTLQNVGLKRAEPSLGALLLSTESPFGVVFAAMFLHEVLNGRMIVGCILIVISIVLAELDVAALVRKLLKKDMGSTRQMAEEVILPQKKEEKDEHDEITREI